LAACGKEGKKSTPTATAAATVATTGSATPVTGGGLTVGALADRIGAAWSGVSTYRAVTTNDLGATNRPSSPTANASPGAVGPGAVELIDEVVRPDRRHRTARANGDLQYEVVVVGGKVYARGPLMPGFSPSRADPNAWVEVDPTAFATPSSSA